MKFGPPEVDYLKFRFSKLNTPRYRHLQLLVFWSLFGICFLILEGSGSGTATTPCTARWTI